MIANPFVSLRKKLTLFLPGIFLIGYNIGTGSLTAMSKSGANFGYDLLWTVFVSCLITWYLINFFSRFTMVSGLTAMEAYKQHIHPAFAWTLWTGLSIIIISALMAMIGLLSDVVIEWGQSVWNLNLNKALVGIGIALFVYILIILGNTRRFESILAIMVALMGVAFIGSAIRFFPDLSSVARGFVPKLPDIAPGSDNSALVILTGMVGTTVSVFAFLIRSGQVKERGWTMVNWKTQKRDAFNSAVWMFILSSAVLITAGATLHEQGLKMNHIKEMIPMLQPLFGKAALLIFTIGILAAGISSHLPNMMVIPWLTDDLKGQPRNTGTHGRRIILSILTLVSIMGAITARPIFLLLLSQSSISVVMPLALIGLMILSNRKSLMGKYRPGPVEWLLLSSILIFSLFISYQAITGLIADIASL